MQLALEYLVPTTHRYPNAFSSDYQTEPFIRCKLHLHVLYALLTCAFFAPCNKRT